MALTVPQALVISVDFTKYRQVGYGISLNAFNKKKPLLEKDQNDLDDS